MRIRTIKPEWLEDERLLLATPEARVLSIALILLADDYGNGRAFTLGSRVFPTEPGKAEPALRDLVERRFVELYEVDGQRYFHIRNWEKHQKVDKPGKPHVPAPGAAKPRRTPEKKVAYFIRGATTGLIKIGESTDPVRRLADLAKGGSERLELLAVGGTERQLHAELASDRVHGEWFRASPAVLAKVIENGGDLERPISSCGYTENHKIDLREHSRESLEDGENDSDVPAPDLRTEGPKDPDRDPDPSRVTAPERGTPMDPLKPQRGLLLRAHRRRYSEATGHDVPPAKNSPADIAELLPWLVGYAQKTGQTFEQAAEAVLERWWKDPYAASKGWPLWHLAKHVDEFAEALPPALTVVKGGMEPAMSHAEHAAEAAAGGSPWS